MFDAYRQGLTEFRQRMSRMAALAQEAGEEALAGRARQTAEQLQQRRFSIAVVGEFKAGKSTLVNSLISEEILPVAAQECTAVVCRIRSTEDGEDPGAELVLAGGKRVDVPVSEVRQYLTVAGATLKGKPVEEANVRIASAAWLGTDVELVDTPGVNASGRARERATLEYLPTADAIVFMTRADNFLSESEQIFLRERVLSQDAARVFVVVNFADRLRSERDHADIVKRGNELLPKLLGHNRMHLLSARDAREAILDDDRSTLDASGLPNFQRVLEHFLIHERAQAELRRQADRVNALEAQLTRTLKQRVQTLSVDDDVRQRRAERIREFIRLTKEDGNTIVESVRKECREMRERVLRGQVTQGRQRMRDSLTELNARNHDVTDQEARQIADRVAGAAHTAVQSELRDAARNMHTHVAGMVNSLFGKVDEELGDGTEIVVTQPSYGTLVTVHAQQVSEPTKVTRENPSTSDVLAGMSGGALLGAIIGGIFGGPAGAWLGAAIGGGFGASATMDHKPFTETVQKMISRRRADSEDAASRFEDQLKKYHRTSHRLSGEAHHSGCAEDRTRQARRTGTTP